VLAIGAIGLILTHTIVTMYTAIFAFIYVLINIKKLKNKEILKKLIVNLIFIVVITSFFWAPLLEHKLAADYEVFKPGRMERTEVLKAFKLDLYELFYSQNDGRMIYQIGLVTLVGLILTPFAIKKLKKENKTKTGFFRIYIFMLISGLVCSLMTLKIFPFEYMPSILKMIQFTFRLLEFSGFFFSFVVAANFGILVKKLRISDISILTIILIALTFIFMNRVHYVSNFDENVFWPAVKVTSNTGRVHAGMASFEYLPCKAFENRSYIETRDQSIHILSGSTQIENEYKENTNMEFEINYTLEETQLELPYIYYLGYTAYLEDGNIKKNIDISESDNGFISITVPEFSKGKIVVKYTGTLIMKISTIISFIGLILLISMKTRLTYNIKWYKIKEKFRKINFKKGN